MTADEKTKSIPQSLCKRLSEHRIIPFVGAGVSRAVINSITGRPLFPSWKELLGNAAKQLQQDCKPTFADDVLNALQLEPPDYLNAANQAREGLGQALWYELLEDSFNKSKESATADSLNLARTVWGLGSKLILTTNYDKVMRWTCEDIDFAEWNITAAVEQAISQQTGIKRTTIWHLHGHIDDKARIILGSSLKFD